MGQEDIIRLLEIKIKTLEQRLKNLDGEDEKKKLLWDEALTKDDIAYVFDIGIDAISRSIHKLLIKEKIISIQKELDQRKRRYMINDKFIRDLVDLWNS